MDIPLIYRQLVTEASAAGSVKTSIPSSYAGSIGTNLSLIGTNTIQLPASASSVDNYYVGYNIVLEKVQANGKTYKQEKTIAAYNGTTKIATVTTMWDIGYEPEVGDTFSIVLASKDARVTINPIMQTFDYVTSTRYGRGLDPEQDFHLATVKSAANKCDARSDVSIKTNAPVTVTAGDVYNLYEGSRLVFSGEVRESRTNTRYVLLTNVIGKLTNKWNSWKPFEVGDIIYEGDKYYRVTTAGVKSKPSHTTGTVGGLEFISTLSLTGPTTLTMSVTSDPILMLNEEGIEISGYTLYDSDDISYWRRMGWDTHSQSSVTLYQTNFTIDTSVPLFDNINMMLEHCNGIFTYSQGKYSFAIEEAEAEFIPVTEDDIIGKISFDDAGNKKAFNSLTVSYSDPGNNFESKNLSLFSKKFLTQDRNVPKKGNLTVSGMTNYYNVRLLADSYLKKSRMNSSIRMTLAPEFIELVPGSVIGIFYDRFRWNNKPFRVESITLENSGLVSIVATEYHDSFYDLTNMNKVEGVGNRTAVAPTGMTAPSNLTATNTVNNNELKDGILLNWTNADGMADSTQTEIYASDTSASVLNLTSIASNVMTFSTAHGLSVGSSLKANNTGNGIVSGRVYYVTEVVSTTQVRVSSIYNGATLALTDGTGLSLTFSPYVLVGSVSYPETQFLHTFPNITSSVTKYYKIRYKAIK